ncbi:alpha-2-macroglobulin family protein [Planctomyces sp. SH-PL14]|uniref:alpha-2-macroglobulin family protein n=1 Tax=Planctomyces sp. SH-PL14 TaxID=1632864 RepID=UPI00078C173D|nr:MG2 domain-containing protein [Planctomyces sp. SH-PL14]AMV17976.1 MG2 domain protein [Planctomyces sp. SH-PL14]
MRRSRSLRLVGPLALMVGLMAFGLLGSGLVYLMAAQPATGEPARFADAVKLQEQGNFKEAYDVFARYAKDPDTAGRVAADAMNRAVQCLQSLQRQADVDAFRHDVVAAHETHHEVLAAAAQAFLHGDHWGFVVAGKFQRGNNRGGGEYVGTIDRDRVEALQLLVKAMPLVAADKDQNDRYQFYRQLGDAVMSGREGTEAWRLQELTDLETLPDYQEGQFGWQGRGRGRGRMWGGGGQPKGAPVDADGNPVYYTVPESWEAAKSDGERWRWALAQEGKRGARQQADVDWRFANFLMQQFDVQTMRQWGVVLPGGNDGKDEIGPFALPGLGEDETIARLATGIKRFKVPDEFNWIRIFKRLVNDQDLSDPNLGVAELSVNQLASIFENRQQYETAAQWWRTGIEKFGPGPSGFRQNSLDQIVKNWGRFEGGSSLPAGKKATLEYRFRNGKEVRFEAHAVKIPELLKDIKTYLQSKPRQLDWQKIQIDNIGWQIVEQDNRKYLGETVASWTLAVEPREKHFHRRVTVETPLEKAGAYLVTARMSDGNMSRVLIWIDDTVIVRKPGNGKTIYYVADAASGTPIPRANMEFFGWRMEYNRKPNQQELFTANFAEATDADGITLADPKLMDGNYQWLTTVRTADGRFAHQGFSHVWYGQRHDEEYNETKVYGITDRPVYRPAQPVKFKFWIGQAKYDKDDKSLFAGDQVTVRIHDPQGQEVQKLDLKADEFGGVLGEYALPDEAKLGQYNLTLEKPNRYGGSVSFRVEEYKKPEFEVTVDAPDKPVMLGEKITATIKAKYYFGAPVVEGTVKYKVERSPHNARWYPARPWDWFYGPGYWWFASEANWYPGYGRWGCLAPIPFWIGWNPEPPELVAEQEVEIGKDGTVEVEIDTALAQELHGDQDHSYTITAEVVDNSRRVIVGTGNVMVAREPFKVFAWTDRGHYRAGSTVKAEFQARTVSGKGVKGSGKLLLLKVSYDADGVPKEETVEEWNLDTDAEGHAAQEVKAAQPGQYRLSYKVTDAERHTIEGGYLFVVAGEGFDGKSFRFNDLELIPEKAEYAPGEKARVMVNVDKAKGTVLFFVRPVNGIYDGKPRILRLEGKSVTEEIEVIQKDMPNFFVEAVTVADGKVHTVARELVVPPEKRVINVEVDPSASEYKPGQPATVKLKLTDNDGKPFVGSMALTMYDRAVEYISGGSNVPEIREFFWKWRRHHNPATDSSLNRWFQQLVKSGEATMQDLGAFGGLVVEAEVAQRGAGATKMQAARGRRFSLGGEMMEGAAAPPAPASAAPMAADALMAKSSGAAPGGPAGGDGGAEMVQPTVRTNFADSAFWKGDITTGADGIAEVALTMPENLTAWKLRAWAIGKGTRVGEGSTEVVTSKNLLVRLQAPRFFVEKDQVFITANVHNYLKTEKAGVVELVLDGPCLEKADRTLNPQKVVIPADGEIKVDFIVSVKQAGEAVITVKALTDEESDAMQMKFPVYVHGMLKTESFTGVVRPGEEAGALTVKVPAERRINDSLLEIRYSPTLAGAMVDALPYLVDYPYGCTEQTLNRFLPTVITQNILKRMKLDLKAIQAKRTNLNAQELGDGQKRAEDWRRGTKNWHDPSWNPVFDEAEVERMVKVGVKDLTEMQLSDGGWGWFSGFGEHSYPHTTAVVVHGLQIAQQNGVALVPGTLERGIAWLKQYQDEQIQLLKIGEEIAAKKREAKSGERYRSQADDLDALVYMMLVDSDVAGPEMQRFLYRDRTKLSLYSAAMFGLALHKQQQVEQRDMILRNIEQFVVTDNENQTTYIDLPNHAGYWWCWYGDRVEANAYYLKLLTQVNPQDPKAAGLVKYLLNNRKNATYWNSTRDTAVCIEALAGYLTASGEDKPDMTIEVWIDGKKHKEVKVTAENLFSFDNAFTLVGDAVETGEHKIELRKSGKGPVYWNAYLTNFSLEDDIKAAGLEVKVGRKFYKLTEQKDATATVQGARGQVVEQKVVKYDRHELANLDIVKSGDLIEIELEIDSKNDYEYLVFEDFKAAGFEPVDLQSGYLPSGLGAYVEFRDEKVAFFVRQLKRGKHSVSYRLRAEIPGQFSALPTKAEAMYAPELKANSDEMKVRIADRE